MLVTSIFFLFLTMFSTLSRTKIIILDRSTFICCLQRPVLWASLKSYRYIAEDSALAHGFIAFFSFSAVDLPRSITVHPLRKRLTEHYFDQGQQREGFNKGNNSCKLYNYFLDLIPFVHSTFVVLATCLRSVELALDC